MKYSTHKDIDKMVRRLVRQGWTFWRGGKHGRLQHPFLATTLTIPGSPGDRRAVNNFASDVKRILQSATLHCPGADENDPRQSGVRLAG
jgi:predicted RNA binding protein YcfA (HicA-like mRNA interferase family)